MMLLRAGGVHAAAQVEDLRRKLEALTELRDLVRSLGRAGGKGPWRRAPEEVRAYCAWSLVKASS